MSNTLSKVDFSANGTRLVPELSLTDIRHIMARNEGVTQIYGPTTAAEALRTGMVDRLELFVVPVMLGQGRRALPEGAYRKMKLTQQRTFDDGTVFLQYDRT